MRKAPRHDEVFQNVSKIASVVDVSIIHDKPRNA
jgi:hypothetical protein